MKECVKCGEIFSEDQFYKDKGKISGRRGYCKNCDKESHQNYVEKNRARINKYKREWYKKHPNRIKAAQRKFRINNIGSALINQARGRARKKGVPFTLDDHRDKLIERVNRLECELTGIRLDPAGRKSFNSVSLDRINPELGYIYSNVRIVAYSVNCALGTWGEEKLREIAMALLKKG